MAAKTTTRATPSETFTLGRLHTPIGIVLLATDIDGVLRALEWEDCAARMKELLRRQYGLVTLNNGRAPDNITRALTGYFNGNLDCLKAVKWCAAGTPFQRKVWTALTAIPPGTTSTYGELAAKLGSPNAMRAVGHANGANIISVVVPCHRLVGSDGSLVKYGSGLKRKEWLLAHEGVTLI